MVNKQLPDTGFGYRGIIRAFSLNAGQPVIQKYRTVTKDRQARNGILATGNR